MKIERHDSGPRTSKAVAYGNMVYLNGLTAEKAAGGSVAAQTREILDLIDGYLARCGTDKSRLLRAHVWLADINDYDEMNRVWDAWVSPGNAPARATVEAKLAFPNLKVEIMVEAAR